MITYIKVALNDRGSLIYLAVVNRYVYVITIKYNCEQIFFIDSVNEMEQRRVDLL